MAAPASQRKPGTPVVVPRLRTKAMFFEGLLRDFRVGFRLLIKDRSFCALAVTALALGICGVTTMFSVVNGVMLRGFAFPNESRLAGAQLHRPDEHDVLRRERPHLDDGLPGTRCRSNSPSR